MYISTILTWNKSNSNNTVCVSFIVFIVLFTYVQNVTILVWIVDYIPVLVPSSVMFPQVPIERIHIICWETTIGTAEGFPCMCCPDMCIATIFSMLRWWNIEGNCTLFLHSTLISTGSSSVPPSFLTGDGVGGVGDGWTFIWGGGVPGGGVGVVIPLSDHSNCGRSPSPAALTASLNMPHPSAIILCPAATVRTAEVHKNIFV